MTTPLMGLMNGDAPSPFGSMFEDPNYQTRRMWDALGGLGVALMQASAPTPYPKDVGTMIGQGMAGVSSSLGNAEDRHLKRMLTGAQVAKARTDMQRAADFRKLMAGDAATAPPTTQPAAPTAPAGGALPREQAAISSIEGDYSSVGPETKGPNGQPSRGYGKYQVMDFNIGPWTQEVLGTAMTPDQFLKDSKAQDAVFNTKFGQLLKKHGNHQDAASAWFSGMPLQQAIAAGNKPDVLGTTPTAYVDKFNKAFNGPGGAVVPGMAIGDGSGNAAQPVQYSPPPQPPRTIREAVQSMPPGIRQIVSTMDPKDGMNFVLKYMDPASATVLDTVTGQVVFIPKTMVGRSDRYQPVEGAKLQIQRDQLANSQRKTDIDERNADVTIGPDGRLAVNQLVLDAKKGVAAAQGTDPSSKITVELAQDAIKRNSDWQKSALTAHGAINRLGTLQTLLDQIATNKFKGTTQEIKAAAKAAGIDLSAVGVTDDVGSTAAAASLSSLLALENRREMPGPMSDGDRQFLMAAGPAITKDPAGNRILIAIKKGDLEREVDIAKHARDYIKSADFKTNPAGLDDYIAQKMAGKSYFDPKVLPQAPPAAAPGASQYAPLYERYGLTPPPGGAAAPSNLYDKYGLKPR